MFREVVEILCGEWEKYPSSSSSPSPKIEAHEEVGKAIDAAFFRVFPFVDEESKDGISSGKATNFTTFNPQ
jgi:hypothetical protein